MLNQIYQEYILKSHFNQKFLNKTLIAKGSQIGDCKQVGFRQNCHDTINENSAVEWSEFLNGSEENLLSSMCDTDKNP